MASCFGQRKQDSCYSWVVCVSASLATAVTMGLLLSFGVVFPVLMDYFKESKDKTAWVGSLGIALIFFTGPLTGIVINRLGCRTTSSVGAVTCAVSLVLTSFSNSIFVMYFSYSVLLGVGTSLVFASALVINAKYFDKRRAFATGILGAGWALGLMCLAPILQTLLDAFGWRHTYRIMSAVVFLICLLGCFYKPLVDNERDAATSIEGDPNLTQDTEREALLQKETANHQLLDIGVWKNPAFVKITLLPAVVQFGRYSPLLHQVRYCEEIGISAESASKLYIYGGITVILSKTLTGRLCDVEWVNARYVCQAASFLAGTATILMTLSQRYTVVVGYILVFTFCIGAYDSTVNIILVTCVTEEKRTSAVGWQWLVRSFFLASGPPLAGVMADKLGSYVPAFYMVGGVMIFGSLMPFFLHCWREETSKTSHRTTFSTEYKQ